MTDLEALAELLGRSPLQIGAGRGFIGTPDPSANPADFPTAAPGTTNLFEDRGVNTGTMGWWMRPKAAPAVEPETTFSKGVRFEKQPDGTWQPILPPTSAAAPKVVEPPEVKALRQDVDELDRKTQSAWSQYQVAQKIDPRHDDMKTVDLGLKAQALEKVRDERRAALAAFATPAVRENPFATDPFSMGQSFAAPTPAPVAPPKNPFQQGLEAMTNGAPKTASSKYRIRLKQ